MDKFLIDKYSSLNWLLKIDDSWNESETGWNLYNVRELGT